MIKMQKKSFQIRNKPQLFIFTIITSSKLFLHRQINNKVVQSKLYTQMLNANQPKVQTLQLPQTLLTKDKKTRQKIERQYFKNEIRKQRSKISAFLHNFQPGYLQPEYEGDQTLKVTQNQIKEAVNIQTASNIFDLKLSLGSYRCTYSQNGSTLLLTSSLGHTSLINWRQKDLINEINLRQKILDAKFLHNDQMYALSQVSHTFVYDNRGIELHKLDKSLGLQYLPYHFLLASYDQRKLKYYDTTTGQIIADHVARNPYTVMRQNKSNAILALGSSKGVVQWWTPGNGVPGVKLFVGSSVTDIGFYKGYMVTASQNIKIWDSRMLKVLYEYPIYRKLNSLEISHTGLLALNYGYKVELFKDFYVSKQTHPYMHHKYQNINNMKFTPFEDYLGLGTNSGFSCISVPGSGSATYDTFQLNPFESRKQKRESLVHRLLDKLAPQTITIDPNVLGNMDRTKKQILESEDKQYEDKKTQQKLEKTLAKKRMRGKGKIGRQINRKTIEMDKIKRRELTKVINKRLWAKWAEKKKKETQLDLIQQISDKGFGIADIVKKNSKTKSIHKDQ